MSERNPPAPEPTEPSVGPEALADHPRYRIVRRLGSGGMGAVYLAEHRRMERLVALKVISPALMEDADAVRRFHQEVRAAASLSHPNIITAYDADEAGQGGEASVHFLVMEYVEGQDLFDYLRTRWKLPPEEACHYAIQVANGLQHAHENGMVHRDIKPSNLMRTGDGRIKILDFGVARFACSVEEGRLTSLTAPGSLMGTPDYVAPEQLSDARSVDTRADLYSLGCTLYHLISGQVPFPGGNEISKALRHTNESPRPLSSVRPDVPEGLSAVVNRLMSKDPDRRYQTPAEAARALEPFALETPTLSAIEKTIPVELPLGLEADANLAPANQTGVSSWRSVPAKGRGGGRHRAVGLAAIAISVVLAAVVGVSMRRGRDKTTHPLPPAPSPDPASTLNKAEPLYREVHGVDGPALQRWMDGLAGDGFFPEFLSVHAGEGEARFNAVAIRPSTPRVFQFRMGVLPERPTPSEEAKKAGFHRRLVCPYAESGQMRLAIIEVRDRESHGIYNGTRPMLQAKFDERKRAGQGPPLNLAHSPPRFPPLFCSQFVPIPIPNWETDLAMDGSPTVLIDWASRQQARGWRPDLVVAYKAGPQTRFMTLAVENPDRLDWVFDANLSAETYQRQLAENAKLGLRPRSVTSSGPVSRPRYTVVWIDAAAEGNRKTTVSNRRN